MNVTYCYLFLTFVFLKLCTYQKTHLTSFLNDCEIKISEEELIFELDEDMKTQEMIDNSKLPKEIVKIICNYNRNIFQPTTRFVLI